MEKEVINGLFEGDMGAQMRALNEIKRIRLEGTPEEKNAVREWLIEGLKSGNPERRMRAATGLEYLLDPETVAPLTEAFNKETDPEAREIIYEALKTVKSSSSVEEARRFRQKLEELVEKGRTEEAVEIGLGGGFQRKKVKK